MPVQQQQQQKKVIKKTVNNSKGGNSISGNMDQLKLEKYQKMMQKVKHGEQAKKMPASVQNQGVPKYHHQRIKSTNEGVSAGLGYGHKNNNHSMERERSSVSHPIGGNNTPSVSKQHAVVQGSGVSHGINQGSQKNLKIMFVGDQQLMMNHQNKSQSKPTKGKKYSHQY